MAAWLYFFDKLGAKDYLMDLSLPHLVYLRVHVANKYLDIFFKLVS